MQTVYRLNKGAKLSQFILHGNYIRARRSAVKFRLYYFSLTKPPLGPM